MQRQFKPRHWRAHAQSRSHSTQTHKHAHKPSAVTWVTTAHTQLIKWGGGMTAFWRARTRTEMNSTNDGWLQSEWNQALSRAAIAVGNHCSVTPLWKEPEETELKVLNTWNQVTLADLSSSVLKLSTDADAVLFESWKRKSGSALDGGQVVRCKLESETSIVNSLQRVSKEG